MLSLPPGGLVEQAEDGTRQLAARFSPADPGPRPSGAGGRLACPTSRTCLWRTAACVRRPLSGPMNRQGCGRGFSQAARRRWDSHCPIGRHLQYGRTPPTGGYLKVVDRLLPPRKLVAGCAARRISAPSVASRLASAVRARPVGLVFFESKRRVPMSEAHPQDQLLWRPESSTPPVPGIRSGLRHRYGCQRSGVAANDRAVNLAQLELTQIADLFKNHVQDSEG